VAGSARNDITEPYSGQRNRMQNLAQRCDFRAAQRKGIDRQRRRIH
jgi:hypothetical protein